LIKSDQSSTILEPKRKRSVNKHGHVTKMIANRSSSFGNMFFWSIRKFEIRLGNRYA